MNLEFFAVPDYVCSGVVEHYCKVSVIVSDSSLRPQAVCSVIVNKKTGKAQRQAKVNKLDNGHIRTAVFGYGKKPMNFCSMDQINNFFGTFDDVVKNALHVCFSDIVFALNMARCKLPALEAEWQGLRDFAKMLSRQYIDIEAGRYENSILPQAGEIPAEEPTAEQIAEKQAEDTPKRAARKVARMVFANGLTEFLSGNVYELELEKDGLPNVIGTTYGKKYYSVLNEKGERRYLDESRIRIEEQFTEPPVA